MAGRLTPASPLSSLTAPRRGIDADKLARVQGNADIADNPDLIRDSTDEDADRALTSVRSKLSTALSVEYTVNDLIQQARDPANLGSIFVGCVAAHRPAAPQCAALMLSPPRSAPTAGSPGSKPPLSSPFPILTLAPAA